jgi:hypothetical protein
VKRNLSLSVVLGVLAAVFLGLLLFVVSDLRTVKSKQASNAAACPHAPVAFQPPPSQTSKCLTQQLAVNQNAQQKAIASADAKAAKAADTANKVATILSQLARLLKEVDVRPVAPGLVQIVPASPVPTSTPAATGHPTPSAARSRPVGKPSQPASHAPTSSSSPTPKPTGICVLPLIGALC